MTAGSCVVDAVKHYTNKLGPCTQLLTPTFVAFGVYEIILKSTFIGCRDRKSSENRKTKKIAQRVKIVKIAMCFPQKDKNLLDRVRSDAGGDGRSSSTCL